MGQKVNPFGFRLGDKYSWNSRWFASGDRYKKLLQEDIMIRELLMNKLRNAGISKVEIERSFDRRTVAIFVARPGIVIGRGGTGLEEIKKLLLSKLNLTETGKLEIRVEEIKRPDLNAYLVGQSAADQLMRRMPFRRVMQSTIERVMRSGARGARIVLAGRLGGAEIARVEQVREGSIPLSTLRADIDFAKVTAHTKSGTVGIKVWIYVEDEQ